MNKIETWTNIIDCDNYQISNFGRVKSFKNNVPRILNGRLDKDGYLRVYLTENSKKRKDYKIHRLVAAYFIDNPNKYRCVNHIDSDKTNNHISNLEWCSHSQNIVHAYKNGLRPQHGKSIKCNIYGIEFNSILEASKKLCMSRCIITNFANNRKIRESSKKKLTNQISIIKGVNDN